MKVFGTDLFKHKVAPTLYDFAQHGILRLNEGFGMEPTNVVWQTNYNVTGTIGDGTNVLAQAPPKKPAAKKAPAEPTPKDIFELKTLNQPEFGIKTDPVYLDTEIATLKEKLELFAKPRKVRRGVLRNRPNNSDDMAIDVDSGAVKYGRQEVESMIQRLTNRKKLATQDMLRKTVNRWPHTTNDAIRAVLSAHKHLEAVSMRPMLPDLPSEAVKAMMAYKNMTLGLCGAEPVFYLIRERSKAADVARKRDPILLAQSPFGFFWQILGAWDKEVVLLEEL